MSAEEDVRALAKRFFDSVEAGDVEALRGMYAPDAQVWHNTDEIATSVDENLKTLAGFVQRIRERRYRDRRLAVFDGGFVQQHVLHGVRADGAAVTLPACIVCQVSNGRITRLDEYFDSARVAVFRAPVTK
jgi:ketosteroid isomerase-like protein